MLPSVSFLDFWIGNSFPLIHFSATLHVQTVKLVILLTVFCFFLNALGPHTLGSIKCEFAFYFCKKIRITIWEFRHKCQQRVEQVFNNEQNLVNVVCERPPNASCSLDFKAVTIVKSVKVSINQLSPTGPWRQLWEVTWYKLMVSSPLECWELFAT